MSEPLFMIQMELPAHRVFRTLNQKGEARSDDGYRLHALLAGLFGEEAPKPFHFDVRAHGVQVLGYAAVDAGTLMESARLFGEPLLVRDLEGKLAGKPMPEIPPGRRVGFSVKVIPTVRTSNPNFKRKGAEVDAWLAARHRQPEAGEEAPLPDREAVYADWFREQVARHGGARLESLRITAMRGAQLVRRDAARNFKRVEQREVVFQGVLETTDAAGFRELLRRGVGRHRAFGYGMLLLTPPGRGVG